MKRIILAVLISTITLGASAQLSLGPIWKLTYDASFTTGELNSKYMENTSWRGFAIKGNWFVGDSENFTMGGLIGFHAFYDKVDRQTYTFGNEAITGTRFKYLYSVPMLLSAQYVWSANESFNPYVSLAGGPYYMQLEDQVGRFLAQNKDWKMGINPEVGIMIPWNIDMGLVASLIYNHVFYIKHDIPNLNYLSLSIGLYFN